MSEREIAVYSIKFLCGRCLFAASAKKSYAFRKQEKTGPNLFRIQFFFKTKNTQWSESPPIGFSCRCSFQKKQKTDPNFRFCSKEEPFFGARIAQNTEHLSRPRPTLLLVFLSDSCHKVQSELFELKPNILLKYSEIN